MVIVTIPEAERFKFLEMYVSAGPAGRETRIAWVSGNGEHRISRTFEPGEWISIHWQDTPGLRATARFEWEPAL